MATFNEFLLSLDPDYGKRGKQFEHFVKWFLKNDPEWSTQVDQVWLWDEYPDSWGRDCGIDLVFKHKNGENWAVQAKCYAATTSITKADVDSFISESNRDGIDKRLLIATTDLIGPNAKQVCDAQDKPVTRFLLSHFEDADIEYPANLDDLPKAKRKEKPKPREHQIEAIDAVALNFKDVDRGQLIMACGTGKTFTTLWIKEKLGVDSTLVLLPSLGLLSQTLHEWTLAANEEFQVLCVCSDESVGRRGSDEAVHSIADLAFPVTSNAGEITAFLNGSGKKVILSTYQSSPLIAEAQSDKAVPAFDLAIADEAHRCAGKVSGDFSTILDEEKIRAKKRLFTTATPRTYSSSVKKAAEDRGVEVVGMDDEAIFGKQLFALSFGEAIKRGLLTDYRVVIIGVDDPTISAWIENKELLKADCDIEMDAESLAAQVGLLKAIKDYDLHRLISFHSRVSRAEDFSQNIHKVLGWIDEKHKPSGELKSDFVSGEMPTDKRRRKLSQLKSLKDDQRGLLTNARCLSEGVDVPSLDGVAFIDPRSSQIDIIQAVGRAIRLSENKKAGTIILPVFIANSDDPEQALEEGNFKPIWDVLNALKSHDDVLADELNEIRTELGRKGGGKISPNVFSKITIDLPVDIDKKFGEEISTYLVEQVTASWEFWYGLLEKYIEEKGQLTFYEREFNTFNLRDWVISQRRLYSSGKLNAEKIARLELIKAWSWDPKDELWEAKFKILEEYVKLKGTARNPSKYESDFEKKVMDWVSGQRVRKLELSEERIRRLESLNGWSWDFINDSWEDNFLSLRELSEKQNQEILQIPQDLMLLNGTNLFMWAGTQRARYKQGKLSIDRISKLQLVKGWSWNAKSDKWEIGFSELEKYVKINGTSLVPKSYDLTSNYPLGKWVITQRNWKDKLPVDRVKKLESLPEWSWDVKNDIWEKGFNELLKYVQKMNSSDVPNRYKTDDGYPLGGWCSKVRSTKSQNKLSVERIKRLEAIHDWKWVRK
ncbi:DEAD/DEAH box helicase [Polynucleobacter bastaniensis]|uniref:DEAD/DEAH box helicase n=1 Tax=Polynucleobacter bastaniensis TaxID=2081039 RepID=UPI001C0BE99C|nr:DEAD/DEAH box helicase [Polynucleobacter bastaniensis]MBU3598565.1 Helicase associated domain protein [Polynucleobacter bastaniensis]